MVNNFTNINKTNNHLSPQIIKYKNYHDILRSKSRSWLRTGTHIWWGYIG